MDSFTPLFYITFPSFLAISIKAWLLVNSNKRNLLVNHWPLMLVFLGTGGTNLVEFLSFSRLINPGMFALRVYYLSLILSFLGLFDLSIRNVFTTARVRDLFINTATILAVLLVGLVFFTHLVVAGYESIDYSITRVAGPAYWLFQVFALVSLALSIGLNLYGSFGRTTSHRKCKATLVCFLPYAVSIIAVIILMQAGIHINASIIVPIATSYLLLVLIYMEDRNAVFRLLTKVPYSRERKSYRLLAAEIEDFLGNALNGNSMSLKEFTGVLEKHVVSLAVEMSNGNQARAADLLNTSKSSVCRKLNS